MFRSVYFRLVLFVDFVSLLCVPFGFFMGFLDVVCAMIRLLLCVCLCRCSVTVLAALWVLELFSCVLVLV